MDVNVNRITNANLYIEGLSCLGMAAEVTIPRIKAKMSDHKGLGMVGTLEVPSGIEKLEAKIKWTSLYLSAEVLTSSIYGTRRYQVWGNMEQYTSSGLTAQLPAKWLFTAALKDQGEVVAKQHEPVEPTWVGTVYHLEQWIAGVPTLIYDVFSNTYIVDGIDQLARYRSNIGG